METTSYLFKKLIDEGVIPKRADTFTQYMAFKILMTPKGYIFHITDLKEERK